MRNKNESNTNRDTKCKNRSTQRIAQYLGKRKWPLEIIRFDIFDKLLNKNKEFNYSETKFQVWKEINI